MCGIYLTNKKIEANTFGNQLKMLTHRGPDNQNFLKVNDVFLGHTRLSIIDLDERSNQPMRKSNLTITFNGEIYNYKELKEELAVHGHRFTTQSDTEVILIGYQHWGEKVVNFLNGMFAFSIYDSDQNIIFSARDRLGVKPFYYSWEKGEVEICSQVQPISSNKTIDYDAIDIYLQTGYIPSPWSIYKEVKKLQPGHYQIINVKHKRLNNFKYWDLEKVEVKKISYPEAKRQLNELLTNAIKIRMRTDVAYGSFLSGGIDSALVSSIANSLDKKKLKTFTIGFQDPRYDESELSKKFSEIIDSQHHEKKCSPNDLIELLPTFFKAYGEPFADSSAIPSLLLNKTVKQNLTVALSGDGGDESFLGYNHFDWSKKILLIFKTPYLIRLMISYLFPFELIFGSKGYGLKNILRYKEFKNFIIGIFTGFGPLLLKNKQSKWLDKYQSFSSLSTSRLQQTADLNIKLWLENDSNVKVDRASMAFGVEVRSPFLDYRIVEFARTLPVDFRFQKGRKKRILRDLLNDYIPEKVFDAPKKGFSIPLGEWIKNELYDEFKQSLTHPCLHTIENLNREQLLVFFNKHISNKADFSTYLWRVFVLSKWLQKHETKK